MKNSTLLFGLAALLSVTNALSQTLAERQVITANYDQQALTLLEAELRKDFETNQRIAFEMAAQKGWETHMTLPNGGNALLVVFLMMEPQNIMQPIIVRVLLQLEQIQLILAV